MCFQTNNDLVKIIKLRFSQTAKPVVEKVEMQRAILPDLIMSRKPLHEKSAHSNSLPMLRI